MQRKEFKTVILIVRSTKVHLGESECLHAFGLNEGTEQSLEIKKNAFLQIRSFDRNM